MVSRTGILSNKAFEENCLEYRALPVGYATINFAGHQPNPLYMGIKTPKYQRASAKPMSADVLAVNLSKNFAGNRAANARQILDLYQREAVAFKPPPVNIVGAYHYRMNDFLIEQYKPDYTQPVSLHPRVSRASRGEQILKQSVSTGTGTDPMMETFEIAFRKRDVAEQKRVSREIYDRLVARGVEPSLYFTEAPNRVDTPAKWEKFINKETGRIANTMRLIEAGRARFANVDYLKIIEPIQAQKGNKMTQTPKTPETPETPDRADVLDAAAAGQGEARLAQPAGIPEV